MKKIRYFIKKLLMNIDIDFYINTNNNWNLLKRDTLLSMPNIGEKVTLFTDNKEETFIVVDVEHKSGKNNIVLLRKSKSLIP